MLLLEIEIDKQWLPANLEKDTSISMEETSQVWSLNAGRSSIPFTLSVYENQHILGNVSDMRGSSVFKRLYGARFRLYVGGILFRTGVVHLDSSVPVTDTIEIELVGNGKEWSELISDLDCRKVPLLGDVLLGTTYTSKSRITESAFTPYIKAHLKGSGMMSINGHSIALGHLADRNPDVGEFVVPSVMKPYMNKVNESVPYDAAHPYCNFRICWQKKDKDGNKVREFIAYEADRLNTSPCFYVLYFFDCLFKHLDVKCIRNRMKDFDEFKRLAFLNTACKFDVKNDEAVLKNVKPNDIGVYMNLPEGTATEGYFDIFNLHKEKIAEAYVTISRMSIAFDDETVGVMNAYATPENFPNKGVSSVVDAIQNLFGMRILYDSSTQSAQIVLIRDILSQTDIIELPCRIVEVHPIHEHKDGFILRYSSDKDDSEVDEYDLERDTIYQRTHLAAKRNDITYEQLSNNISAFDKTYYVDPVTGNGYVIKVDKDATTEKELYPTVMEASQFVRVEYGDCSDKAFVEEVSIDANPVVMTYFDRDTGEAATSDDGTGAFAFFVDVDMIDEEKDIKSTQNRKITLDSFLGGTSGNLDAGDGQTVTGYMQSRYDIPINIMHRFHPTHDMSSSMESPLDTYDCGLTLGFMRGPGNQAGTEVINENFDGEGNSQWVTVSSNSAFHSDTIDMFGNAFDYNGETSINEVYVPDRNYAATLIRSYFPHSTGNLLAEGRRVDTSLLKAAGYENASGDYATYFSMSEEAFGMEVLFTPIMDNGNVIRKSELLSYIDGLRNTSADIQQMFIQDASINGKGILIGFYDDAEESDTWANVLHELGDIYYRTGSGTVLIPERNGIGGDPQRISLKLKAEKKVDGQYLPVTGVGAARRGIFDNFYAEYAYWVTHRKLAHIEAEVELADLINLDMTKKYRIGDYVGFIKSCKYDVSDTGLGLVTFELYYL